MFRTNQPVTVNQFAGAIAASLAASCFIIGFVVYITLIAQAGYPDLSQAPAEQVIFMMANNDLLQTWYAIIYLLFGICLVVLVPILHRNITGSQTLLNDTARIFGLIWSALVLCSGLLISVGIEQITLVHMHNRAQASALWQALYTLLEGLGGGNELVGGLWILLTSAAAQRSGCFARWLSVTGMLVGVAGVGTLFPWLTGLEAIFGLGAIVWFCGIAVSILNSPNVGR